MAPDDLASPGRRIKFLRQGRGMTQLTLAAKTYVTQPAVSQWESGKYVPDRATQDLIAEALGTTRTFLFGEAA